MPDFSCTALWFNSVEKSIFYERLQGKTVDQAVIEGFFRNFTFQRDTAAVTVLLDQKIVLHQIQLFPQGNPIMGTLGNAFNSRARAVVISLIPDAPWMVAIHLMEFNVL